MEFRPCIDIHNGKVKQIVGGSLNEVEAAEENFVSEKTAAFYAEFYKKNNLKGGHIIMLNPSDSEFYAGTKLQAIEALHAYSGGMQIGGSIHADNAVEFIEEGASHVIVTSYIFKNGRIQYENLKKLFSRIGKERIVLDLSCKKKSGQYYIVTDRWQNNTNVKLDFDTFNIFEKYCSEFLIHAVDVEGKSEGIEEELVKLLGRWGKIPITYAGGVHNFDDLKKIKEYGQNKINVTIGSALDLFGGQMKWQKTIEYIYKK